MSLERLQCHHTRSLNVSSRVLEIIVLRDDAIFASGQKARFWPRRKISQNLALARKNILTTSIFHISLSYPECTNLLFIERFHTLYFCTRIPVLLSNIPAFNYITNAKLKYRTHTILLHGYPQRKANTPTFAGRGGK
jgi:hypothetical protein